MDACRYDKFKEVNKEQGWGYDVEPVWTAGHETGRWYMNAWNQPHYPDITLISDNPVPWRRDNAIYHKKFKASHPLWKLRSDNTLNGLPTIDRVVEEAHRLRLNIDGKTVIHLIPPHLPYYFDEGMEWLLETFGGNVLGDGRLYMHVENYGRHHGFTKLVDYYKRNIVCAIEEIQKYDWGTNAVISADHGELIGEGALYTHSNGGKEEPLLRTVPWIELYD